MAETKDPRTAAFDSRVGILHDDVVSGIGPHRYEELPDYAVEGATQSACELIEFKTGAWPDLTSDRVWEEQVLPAVLENLELDYDDVYRVVA